MNKYSSLFFVVRGKDKQRRKEMKNITMNCLPEATNLDRFNDSLQQEVHGFVPNEALVCRQHRVREARIILGLLMV